ncbi:cytoskeleton-associated 5 isoform X1 [Brachionus plicatilis]|uniref:Cytoskeleton-associated 5 isoform X1 n=1 Tax=Brachionus plicatilis TaxID=10195 RepID=A0A3M7RW43_BRAPC|nr:cytoskeleton-associated 5 isoform X1 [Brachionus plicatilis]
MTDENDWKKLSTEDKCEHKNWKARVEGYEECCKLFGRADDPKNPAYSPFLGLVKKFVVDSNEVAKDKALDAVLAYVENIPAAAKTAGEVVPGLIQKCLNGKTKIKEKAFEIILMYIEAEKQETVQEELIKGLENKQPKVVQACLEILRRAISEFSSKTLPIKPIVKFIPKLLEDRDKNVREEAKLMAVEMYRWVGQAIMPQFQGLKPTVMQELEEGFKAASTDKPRQTRFLRSQQDLKAKMEQEMENKAMSGSGGGDAVDGVGEANSESVDPYDLMDPVEILSKLPKDFREKLEAKKWQERKESLDTLQGMLAKYPRLQVADYHELVSDLKKVIAKDANINCVLVAAKCVTGLASGLRKDFSKYALICIEPIMEKFKEKKQHIVEGLREACDAIYPSTSLEAICEICVGLLGHKTPVVRQQVGLFLARCFAMSTQTTLPKKVLKQYMPPLVKNLSEADPSVRDSSSEALGAVHKAFGEKIFFQMTGEIEPLKMEKIKEYSDKCVLLNLRGEPRAGQAQPAASVTAKSAPSAKTETKPAEVKTIKANVEKKTVVKKPGSSDPKAKSKPGAEAKKPSVPEEADMAQETVEEKALELFGAECVNGLASSNWKERQSSIETLNNCIKRMVPDDAPVQVIVRTLAKKPGFKDSHFQVLKQRLELVASVAEVGFKFSQRSASYCLTDIADKIGDAKASEQAKNALSKIGDQCTLSYVVGQVLPSIFEAKNPKNQEHCLLWLSQAIREFGFQGCEVKLILSHIKGALANSNASVRNAAVQLIGTVHMYVGPSFRSFFEQEKPALLDQIDAEIDKVKAEKAPVPIRGKNVPSSNSASDGAHRGEEELDPMQAQLQQEALMPRTDIGAQLNEDLINQMNDKNWKERQAALEKIELILRENKFIEANLNDFPTNLNKRLTDTNKVLATASLKICEKLAAALGSQGRKFVPILAPGMIQALSDSKEALRKTAVSALNSWYENCGGITPFFENDLMTEIFSSATNPNIKAELCAWLAQTLPKCKGKMPPELKSIIPSVFGFVEDRNPEVRTKSQELICPLMMALGPNDLMRALQKLKPTSVNIIQPLIEKARLEYSAKQAPAPKPPTTGPKITKPAERKDLYADSPEESMEEAAPVLVEKKKDTTKAKEEKSKKEKEADKKAATSAAAASSKKKAGDDEDLGPIMQISNKTKRMEDEKSLKTLKWNFDVPRKDYIDLLRQQMDTAGFNRTLMSQLFHDDFKYQIMALQTLTKAVEELPDATLSNLDLVLRWLTLRFFETNPTVILKAIDYMSSLFNMLLHVKNYHLVDYEANSFIPYFIGKLGDPKDPIRKGFRSIIKQIALVYSPVKVFNFLLQGLVSKNARQRAECLEELGLMIENQGLNQFNPSGSLKEIAKQIGDRDNGVRNAALNTITIAYQIVGDQVYKFVGRLNEKDQSMLDERIKRSAKTSGLKASASGSVSQKDGQKEAPMPPLPVSNQMASPQAPIAVEDKPPSGGSRVAAKYSTTPRKGQSLTQQIVSPSSNRPLPKVKGEFSLDIKDDEDDKDPVIAVKLTSHKDLDDLLNKPIDLPPPRKNMPPYPITKLKETQDCKEAIELVITHISHSNIEISIQNLLQIDVVIKDKEKKQLFAPHIDNFLNTVAMKLAVANRIYLEGKTYPIEMVFKLYKGILHCVMDLFDSGLGKSADVESLQSLFDNLLSLMTDERLSKYSDGDQLVRAINLVMLKLLETSNQTNCFCSLVRLLTDSCDVSQKSCTKYLELVMKCIWRQIRRLSPQSSSNNPGSAQINEALIQQIDTSKVLNEIHSFLKMYPSSSWSGKSSDLPLRTVKTLVFHLAKAKQAKIIDDLAAINVPDDSEIKIYIMKLFKNGFQLSSNSNNGANQVGSNFGFSSNKVNIQNKTQNFSSPKKLTSPLGQTQLSNQLGLILKKIVDSETSNQGLNELYDFKIQNPDFDCDKYFKKSSGHLQAFIEENLKRIEAERNKSPSSSSTSSTSSSNLKLKSSPESTDFKTGTRNVDDIMKTIADWKSKTNLNNLDDDDNDENNLRTYGNDDHRSNANSGTARLFQKYQPNSGLKSINNESENSIKPERYMDLVKDLKKKYTRSRTESDQLNDLKQLDMKVNKFIENSSEQNSLQSQTNQPNTQATTNASNNGTNYIQTPPEDLLEEYRRRFELIKNVRR